MPTWTTDRIVLSADYLPWAGHWPADAIPAAIAEAQSLLTPQAVYGVVAVLERTPQGPLLSNGLLLHSSNLQAALAPAGHLALAVCTIGPSLEARTYAWSEQGQLARALLFDAMGNTALQQVSHQLQQHIAAEVAPLALGCEHSPGQDDWPLEDQVALFTFLQPERIGVRLNEYLLMSPLKSVSWAIPIGREGELPKDGSACSRCPRSDCPYRSSATELPFRS